MGAWIALNQFNYFKSQIKGFIGIGSAPEFLTRLMWNKFPKKTKKELQYEYSQKETENDISFYLVPLDLSINSLKRLGYFETVNYELKYFNTPQSLDIIIKVKERNTGSATFGVGYSSLNNTSFTFGLNERNFLGEGKKLRFEANLSDQKTTYNIGITEPYFLDRHLSLFGNIFDQESENSKGDVKTNKTGFDLGIGFKLNDISQRFKYNFSNTFIKKVHRISIYKICQI